MGPPERIRDASHVDVAWAFLIACAVVAYALLADGDLAHRVLAAGAVGNAGVIASDAQLAAWRADAANKGKTARSWSRQPNYFFEFVTWLGVALVATAAPWG